MRIPPFALLLAGLAAPAAAAPKLACPAVAPAEWGLGPAVPLDQPAVLSERSGVAIDETAPPSLTPDRGFGRGTVWHNIWLMGDEPGWSHYLDCRYRGSDRVLRLKADGLRQCEQTVDPWAAKAGIGKNARQAMSCD